MGHGVDDDAAPWRPPDDDYETCDLCGGIVEAANGGGYECMKCGNHGDELFPD